MRGLHFVRNYDPRFDYTPLGAWSYFLYTLLFSIPIIGFIFAIVFAVGGTNRINLRNYASVLFLLAFNYGSSCDNPFNCRICDSRNRV